MSLILALTACGLLGPGEPEVDPAVCASQATDLSHRLTADARVLAARHPGVEAAAKRAAPARVEVPLRPTGATEPVIVLELDGEVAVGPTAGVPLSSEALPAALEAAVAEVAAPAVVPAPAELSAPTREAWEAWSAAVASPAPTLVLDGRAPGAAAARLLEALHGAGIREVELVVALPDAPEVDAGVAPVEGEPWAGCDYATWAREVAAAPMAMRPWLYADRATTAFATCGCAPQADQVVWHLTSTFQAPAHAAVRVRLDPGGREVPAGTAWSHTASRLVKAAAGGTAVWLVTGEGPTDMSLPVKAGKRPLGPRIRPARPSR